VETGSFTTAEARVNLTQPAVSLHDTVDDREASALSDPKSSTRPQSSVSDLARNQNLVFPAILTLGKTVIKADGKDIPLSPGMAVTVEVLTGKRRALDYILSPLREVTSSSAHER
jgi:hemolysin D